MRSENPFALYSFIFISSTQRRLTNIDLKQTVRYFFSKDKDLFRISRELKYTVCNHDKPHASLFTVSKGEDVNRREKEADGGQGARVNKKSLVFIVCQERIGVFIALIELCYH